MKLSLLLWSSLAAIGLALPAEQPDRTLQKRAQVTVTAPAPDATYVGLQIAQVDQFQAIPYVQAPIGQNRFRPPLPFANGTSLGTVRTDGWIGATCPQNILSTDFAQGLPQAALARVLQTPLFQAGFGISEDCLWLNVYRPSGIDASAKLPVLFWMHGGGFTMGFNFPEEGVPFASDSIAKGKPIVVVTATYRSGTWGFLAGKEVSDAGVGNLGLQDQRRAMEWVADNIEAFGGDPDKVTIWGESAGAISVFQHLVMYDGDHTYKGKPLFRAGIMNSGSIVPVDPVDCPKGQKVFDTISSAAGCDGAADRLQCLRDTPLQTLLEASTLVPTFTGYDSIALSFIPRPDGVVLTKSPEILLKEGKFARVPVIIGDEEDEGTLWSQTQFNLTTKEDVAEYLNIKFFHHATRDQMNEFVNTYQTITEDGSPFRTGLLNNWYPQYKRVAAILGDLAFTLSRRYFLVERNKAAPALEAWSYMNSYFYGLPIIGTIHGSDIFHVLWGVPYDQATDTIRRYYLSFITHMDPNVDNDRPEWPTWESSNQLLWMFATSQTLRTDDFRQDSYEWIASHVPELTM